MFRGFHSISGFFAHECFLRPRAKPKNFLRARFYACVNEKDIVVVISLSCTLFTDVFLLFNVLKIYVGLNAAMSLGRFTSVEAPRGCVGHGALCAERASRRYLQFVSRTALPLIIVGMIRALRAYT